MAGERGLYGVSLSLSLSSPDEALREVVVVVVVVVVVEVCCRGLNVSGEVQRVALELGEGDGRMLQVVKQHLDLCHDVV